MRFEHSVQLILKCRCFLWHRSKQVLRFADVVLQVVKLLAAVLIKMQKLPVTIANDAARFGVRDMWNANRVMPDHWGAFEILIAFEKRYQVHAVLMVIRLLRQASHGQERRVEIRSMHRCVTHRTGLDDIGPVDETWHPDAAFVDVAFVAAQRTIFRRLYHSPIVGGEDDDRVLSQSFLLQPFDHPPDVFIE